MSRRGASVLLYTATVYVVVTVSVRLCRRSVILMPRLIGIVTECGLSEPQKVNGSSEERQYFNFSVATVRMMVPEEKRDRMPEVGEEVNVLFDARYPKGGGRPFLMMHSWERASRYAG